MKCPNNPRKLFGFEFLGSHDPVSFFVEKASFSEEYHIKFHCKYCGSFMDRRLYVSQAQMISYGYKLEKLKKIGYGARPEDLK
jgi:hypothetical protein